MHDLLLIPIIFLAAAVLLVPLAQRFGLGSVLGYLIGGAIIGPWGLAVIDRVDLISHVAEIGVVLMLFLIGLELQPAKLLAMRGVVFGGGAAQMALGGVALGGAGFLLGLPFAAAVIAGIALSLSSTAIAVQNMKERCLENTPAGRAAFGVLLFQDLAAIPLLIAIPLLGGNGASHFNWAGALAAVAAVLVVGRFAMRPALRLIARTGMREIFTAFALLLVLGIAQLMAIANLSMGLGAFLAGVLLAGSEYRKALETDLEPFKGLLLGLFFTSVGMSVNFGLLAEAPARIVGLTLAYVVLKMLLLWLASLALPVPKVQRWPFAGLLAQGSEFAFVALAVAGQAGAMSGRWQESLVLVVALSMATTPVAVLAGEWLSRRGTTRKLPAPDVIEPEGASVIIAGFGRVGQIAGRMLAASGIKTTVLDNDPDLIDMLRTYGMRVFYGDATRLDLLRSAGAADARVLINAIDNVESSLHLTDVARQHFPHLTIIARARNVQHLFELRQRGVHIIERETFESALLIGQLALEQLGAEPGESARARAAFRDHNLKSLESMFNGFSEADSMVSREDEARQELAESLERDRHDLRKPESGAG